MACNHKMLAKKNKKTGEVKFLGAVSNYTPQQIRDLENTLPNYNIIKLPCGRCIGCRLAKAKEWAVRIMKEAQTSSTACFITLTFDEEKLFDWFYNVEKLGEKKAREKAKQLLWTLDVKTFQKFMKRLRKDIAPLKVRFFHCGEYGSLKGRPHHHAIIFGYDFPDKEKISYKKLKGKIIEYYVSPQLSQLWKFGYHIISDVTEESAGYCARYVTKKVNGDLSDLYYNGRKKEYITMSRNHGIGYDWFVQFGHTDCYPQDFLLTSKQYKIKPPRYFDKLYDLDNPEAFSIIKKNRESISRKMMMDVNSLSAQEDRKERQSVIDELNSLKLKRLKRCLEDKNLDDYKFIEFVNKCSAFGIPNEFIDTAIKKSQQFENEHLSALQIANQYLDSVYGNLTYKDLEE